MPSSPHISPSARTLIVAMVCAVLSPIVIAADELSFSKDVLPILSENCFHCHGPDAEQRPTELRLDDETGALPSLSRPDGHDSELLRRIESDDPEDVMPPVDSNRSLTGRQKQILRQWIESGSPWGRHWSFEPLTTPSVPEPAFPDSPTHNAIDHFVQARLQGSGLRPSPSASKETLLRRVTLDLTGLPPTLEEQQAFLNDESPDAWDKVVDRLLASTAYGERMAWDWLNAARYADSNGYQGDRDRSMWPWREWVVDAFNRNMPFDTFTVHQLAGDLLPNATFEQKLATGFCRNHMINGEGGRIAEENRVDYVMDMTETTGTIWLGLTFNCCRCHDHKFDPLRQQDYYQLYAFFNQTPVTGGGGDPTTAPNMAAPPEADRRRLGVIGELLSELDERRTQRAEALAAPTADWEQATIAKLRSRWSALQPVSAEADHQTLTILDDQSVLASGPNPANDVYRIICNVPPGTLGAVRLQALRHPAMTEGGLSRAESSNFVLTGIEFTLLDGQSQTQLTPESAVATFEQGSHKITTSFDGRPDTGWAVYENRPVDRDHAAVYRFKETVTVPPGAKLAVTLRHQSTHAHHNLGRVRFAVASQSDVGLASDQDQLLTALLTDVDRRSEDQQQRVRTAWLADDTEYATLTAQRDKLQREETAIRKRAPKVMIMQDRKEPRETFVLTRGLYNVPSDHKVVAATPASLPAPATSDPLNRLDLARWLVSDTNPLTARVTVNRFWQQVFGLGLVKTTEDFGVQGEYPVQKDLLDWLAADFRDHGWDVKRLMKQIVTSHTYRQSSAIRTVTLPGSNEQVSEREIDADNRLLARSPRYRLPSFVLRDQALAACGLLNRQFGGPPVHTYQPPGVWAEPTFGKKKHSPSKGQNLYRRSLYIFWRRIVPPTVFFDNASRQTCTVKVLRTNTPLHSLLTLNETTYVESARTLAQTLLQDDSLDDQTRLQVAGRRILCRSLTSEESAVFVQGLSRSRAEYLQNSSAAMALLSVGSSQNNGALDPVEHAAWTSLCLALLNLDETLTRE